MFFKYIYQFFIVYISIHVILKKKCFNKNDNKIVLISLISSFASYIIDKINMNKEKKDFLSNVDKKVLLH